MRVITTFVLAAAVASACNGKSGAGIGPSPANEPLSRSIAVSGPGSAVAAVSAGSADAFFGGPSVNFPPQNEPYDFRQQLEVKYRDGLRRAAVQTFVDLEGDVVWTQEYLRYRVNGCDHLSSVDKVFMQIDGAGIQPVCGSSSSGQVLFPPRNEPFDFRQRLEVKYRDGLRRGPTSTFVDLEGDIVWTQEYLRYRVNACDHSTAVSKVFAQIDGRGIQADCTPPSDSNLSGLWNGTSTYVNAPFQVNIVQNGTIISGQYSDRHDGGFVSGNTNGLPGILLRVDFGDTGILLDGQVVNSRTITGVIRVGVLSGGPFPFTMTR
jgi:hypothetical protein